MDLIPVAAPHIGERELAYVMDAVRSGWVSSLGAYVERFEHAFADYLGVAHAISVCNGTAGLHLALHALGIGCGDEVIVPDLTFVATAHAVLQTGATPVLVDVEPDTWCLDPVAVERAITAQTRAILPVHLYGHPAEMGAIQRLAEQNGLLVIEDAAEAHGAEYHGRRVGGIGVAGVFSFYGNKIITTGEGGMVTTNDADLAARLRFLKDHGMCPEQRYYHTEVAFNYRLTNMQAALGLAQLEQIEEFIAHRRRVYRWYAEGLGHGAGLQLNAERPDVRNVFWMTSLVLSEDLPTARKELADRLYQQGIDTRPFFVPLHELPHLSGCRAVGHDSDSCPQAQRLGRQGLNLPSGPALDEAVVERIVAAILGIIGQQSQGVAGRP